MSLITQLALTSNIEPLHAGSGPPEPLEPCAPANPANRASPSMLASFPANMVNHDSPPLENPSNRFCLFGTRSSRDARDLETSIGERGPKVLGNQRLVLNDQDACPPQTFGRHFRRPAHLVSRALA